MAYDLLIRNGLVVDGTGAPGRQADVAIEGGRIASVGRLAGASARETLDAEGKVVAPGFIDGHTHMDAQLYWDALGTCSSYHGITTVVMGNCGFTLAPSRDGARELVVRNLERAEDISPAAMAQAITWGFETFPEYFDVVDKLPKGINYSGYVGHSALRTYVMGERAFTDEATPADLEAMLRELRAGMRAGAMGFTTSRSINHQTSDDRPVSSRLASWDEVCALVNVAGEFGGIFEITNEEKALGTPEEQAEYFGRMEKLALGSGATFMFGVGSWRLAPQAWRSMTGVIDRVNAAGGRFFGQVHSRRFDVILSFTGQLPFDRLPLWSDLRAKPLAEQKQALRDPAFVAKLVHEAHHGPYGNAIGAEARKPDFDWIFLMEDPLGPHRCLGELARQQGMDPVALMIEIALATDFGQIFLQAIANENPDNVLALMKHPSTLTTFSDAGAHVSQISDCSIATHLLGHWVRREQKVGLEEAVHWLTGRPAAAFGFEKRGNLREGHAGDVVVFDPKTIGPEIPKIEYDLPGGARRLVQKARGIAATIVAGQVLLRDGVHTGALPGKLLRRNGASN